MNVRTARRKKVVNLSCASSSPSSSPPWLPPHRLPRIDPLLASTTFWQAAKARKASRIFAIDTNPSKFELAKQLGATDCLNPKDSETPIQQVSLPTAHNAAVHVHVDADC